MSRSFATVYRVITQMGSEEGQLFFWELWCLSICKPEYCIPETSFVRWAFLLCSPNNLKSGETTLEAWFYTSLSLGFFQLIGKQCVIFLCRGCTQLGNELFIIRLCTYVEICIVSRSYGTVSWQRLVSNLGILRISNYLVWLVGICRPLLEYMLACWCWHLPKIKGIFRSGLSHGIDKEARGWYVREENQISLSSFFLPGFPSLHTSNHYFPSFSTSRSSFPYSSDILFQIS